MTAQPEHAAAESRRVVRQSGLTSIAATVAVLSGLALDITVAASFGAGADTDAFAVAARLPLGLMGMLTLVGNQALVPSFSIWLVERPKGDVWRLVSAVLTGAMLLGLGCALVLAVLAVPLTMVMAPGFDAGQHALAARLALAMAFVVPLTAGSETIRAVLNARYSFVVPALMAVALNAVTAALVLLTEGIAMLPVAYVAGAAAQFLVMLGFARVKGVRLTLRPPMRDPEVRAVGRLCVRPFVAAGLNPLARVVEMFFASFLPTGSATILHYGNRLITAIGGTVLFRSVVVAVVPRMTRAVGEQRTDDLRSLTLLGLRIILALALPVTAALAVLGEPAAGVVFAVGRFEAHQAHLLGLALAVYAGSLVGSAVQRALLAPFVASKDTRTPLRNTVYGVLANVLLLPVLVLPARDLDLAVLSVPVTFALAKYVNVAHAWWRLHHGFAVSLLPVRAPFLRTLAASGLAASAMVAVVQLLDVSGRSELPRGVLFGYVVLTGLLGATVYVATQSALVRRTPIGFLRELAHPGAGGDRRT